MKSSRLVLLAVSMLVPLPFAPALAQEHESGHSPGPASVSAFQPSFAGGVKVAVGDVNGDGKSAPTAGADVASSAQTGHHNGFVSRFSAGGRVITPLDDRQLKAGERSAAGRYSDITLKRGTSTSSSSAAPLHVLPGAQGGAPVDPDRYGRVKAQLPQLPAAPGHSAPRVRMAQPYAGAPSAGGLRAGPR
jgi:hypothetical protein